MAVRANHIALCDLVEHRPPAAIANTSGDVELLVGEVVELKDERIVLAAIDTASLVEEVEKIVRAFVRERPFAPPRLRHVPVLVLRVVLLFIRGVARTAVVVPLRPVFVAPSEIRNGLELAASAISP
jgi:hypothetical protein